MEQRHKTKVEVESAALGHVLIETDSEHREESALEQMKSSSSIYALPSAELVLRLDKRPVLNQLARGDRIRVSASAGDQPWRVLFVGEVTTYRADAEQAGPTLLTLQAVSSFYRLAAVVVGDADFDETARKSLRAMLAAIIRVGRFVDKFIVDGEVDDAFELGPVDRFPAISLIKQVCQLKNLVFECHVGDEFRLLPRGKRLREKRTPVVHLGPDDVKSMTVTR